MISGINSYNSIYGYQSVINQARLMQAMQKNPKFSSVSAVKPVNSALNASSGSVNYLKQYSSSMTDLMSSANALRDANSSSVTSKLAANSSNSEVLTAEGSYSLLKRESYQVNVEQLAAAQTNQSTAVDSRAYASEDIQMQLAGSDGSASISVSAVGANGIHKTNSQLLADTAKAVNEAGIGVKASVVTKDGKSSLQLTSEKTGADNGFSVTGAFAAAGGMDNVTQTAQDAQYSVTQDGRTKSFTSDSNTVGIDYGKINVTLKKTGEASINVGTDSNKIVSAMEDFVKSYNSAVTLLSNNIDRGYGTSNQLAKLIGRVPGSDQGLEQMGLSVKKDGTLSLDKEKLTESLQKDPDFTRSLISGSSGLAQRAFSAAQSGLGASSSSLISDDLAQEQFGTGFSQSGSGTFNQFTLLNSLARSGTNNLMNYYAAGAMFNMIV